MVFIAVSPPSPSLPAPGVAAESPAAPKRFAIFTLGCKVNSFESEHLAQQLSGMGYRRVEAGAADAVAAAADLCLINTCTVTAEAARQARQLVRRAARRHPAARIVVTGCYAQMDAAACAAIPGVDAVVGNARKLDIPALLRPLFAGELPRITVDDFTGLDRDIGLPSELLGGFKGRARAFVQIQQGCDRGCTFCIIHKARGPSRSFSPDLVCAQVDKLVAGGFREVVICGVDVGAYGDDFGDDVGDARARPDIGPAPPGAGEKLASLLARLAARHRDLRLRLSSIDPAHITDSLIDLVASDAVCPQLHLSLQSADTLILKRMKRRANRDLIFERIAALRRRAPHATLSADILVGFPTETAAQFQLTLDAVDDLEIAWPHVFAYSPRRGTPAARIPGPRQVPPAERKRRAAAVRERGAAVWQRVAKRRIGARLTVLVESIDAAGAAKARAADYFPVAFDARATVQAGDFAEVEVTGVGDAVLRARQAHKPL